jgi:hypothetical protein
MTLATFKTWLMQKTTIFGFASLAGGVASAFAHGDPAAYVPLIVGGAVAIAMPENTTIAAPIEQTTLDVIHAAASGGAAGAVKAAITDAPADIAAVQAALATGVAAEQASLVSSAASSTTVQKGNTP